MHSQEIAEKVAKYFTGELSSAEETAFKAWKDSDEGQREFKKYAAIWQQSGKRSKSISEEEKQEAFRQTLEIIKQRESQQTPVRNINSSRSWLRVAASIMLFSLLGLGAYFTLNQSTKLAVIKNDSKRIKTVTLPDGSLVHLQQFASVSYKKDFSGTERAVDFEGQGYFEISPDANKRFVVNMDNSRVTVLGTKFNISTEEEITKVDVTEGKVKFEELAEGQPQMDHLILNANDSGILKKGKLSQQSFQHPNFLAWKTGKLRFENTPIKEVVQQLSSNFKSSFRFKSNNIIDCAFTAEFKDKPIEQIVKTIERSFGWTIKKDPKGTYIIEGQSCS